MSDQELATLFSGYGYEVCIVKDMKNIDVDMAANMDWAYRRIRTIQSAARSGSRSSLQPPYFWPLIVLRTPKGFTGPKQAHGQPIEGSFRSHQVPLPNVGKSVEEFQLLEMWLKSYRIHEIIAVNDGELIFEEDIARAFPPVGYRMGENSHTFEGYRPLKEIDWRVMGAKMRGEERSSMKMIGDFLTEVVRVNPKRFRIFSPDEMCSNKLDAVFSVTGRNFQWDNESEGKGGRVIEVLSEHTCQGFMQGYVLTGRVGLFPSYEAFLGIITTMAIQYAKFLKISKEVPWRKPLGSLNYIETSTLWRQEHNGFSHQNPGFINNVLTMKSSTVRVYLPPDGNCFLSTIHHCLQSRNYVNLMIASKHLTPIWLSLEEAQEHCMAGASVWKFCSTDNGVNPDVVLVGCGAEVTLEVIAAASMLKKDAPKLRIRVVNVTDLMILSRFNDHPHALSDLEFVSLFTEDRPVVFNFHGYPSAIKGLLFDRPCNHNRFAVHGYIAEGTTTTPFRMLTANHTSRYDIAIDALRRSVPVNPSVAVDAHRLIAKYQGEIRAHEHYILEQGKDPDHLLKKPEF